MALQSQFAWLVRDSGAPDFGWWWLVTPKGERSRTRRLVVRGLALLVAGLLGLGTLVVAVVYAGGWLVSSGVLLLSRGTVWLVVSMADGVSLWALLGEVLDRIGSAMTTPAVGASLVGLEVLAVLALYGLHRALRLGRAGGEADEEDT